MRDRYVRAMDVLHRACLVVAGICLVIITAIIPWGVFTRYVLNYGSSWPEPMAVLLMIWFSFVSAAVCYREGLHIAVGVLPGLLGPAPRRVLGWTVELAMMAISVLWAMYVPLLMISPARSAAKKASCSSW